MTEQVQVQPAQISSTGEIQSLPIYRTETRQKIVSPRVDNWFETPCISALTPDVIATLQRALEARGFYGGAINSGARRRDTAGNAGVSDQHWRARQPRSCTGHGAIIGCHRC
ncbi:hypothetical protein [Sulfitobacter pontiacus]|uniref:hypothetical protein n=1 Tax=Sulfitobacter pontiacus TaxID=60137 RepID=UPI003461FF27